MKKVASIKAPERQDIDAQYAQLLAALLKKFCSEATVFDLPLSTPVMKRDFLVWLAPLVKDDFFRKLLALEEATIRDVCAASSAKRDNARLRGDVYNERAILSLLRKQYIAERPGFTVPQLVALTGLSKKAVYKVRAQIARESSNPVTFRTTRSERAALARTVQYHCNHGCRSDEQIAALLGIPKRKVQAYRLRAGIKRSRRGSLPTAGNEA